MQAGALGVAIRISGKLGGDVGRTEKFSLGYLKFTGEPAEKMRKAYATAQVKLGYIGIQVRILGEVPKDIEAMRKVEKMLAETPDAVKVVEVKREVKPEEKEKEAKEEENESEEVSEENGEEAKKEGDGEAVEAKEELKEGNDEAVEDKKEDEEEEVKDDGEAEEAKEVRDEDYVEISDKAADAAKEVE
jgi:ribosomal protein S3